MIKHFCDRCKKEIIDGVYNFDPLVHIKDIAEGKLFNGYCCGDELVSGVRKKYDLCLSCYNKVYTGAYKVFAGINEENEIERKFLLNLNDLPKEYEQVFPYRICQTYLQTDETEIRIRSVLDNASTYLSFFLTIKAGEGRTRKEKEFLILESTYKAMFKGIPISKNRIGIKHGNYILEVDMYDNLNDLVVIEVEFPSEAAADEFVVPEWFGKEVTDNKAYKNKNLWKKLQK